MAVAKPCLLLSEHLPFLRSKKEEICVKEPLLGLVEAIVRKVLSCECEITVNEEMFDSAEVFSVKMLGIQAEKKENIWSSPIGLPSAQSFPQQILHFLSLYRHESSQFQSCRHIPTPRWYPVWRGRFHEVGEKVLLALEYGVVGFNVMSSTVENPHSGRGVFLRA